MTTAESIKKYVQEMQGQAGSSPEPIYSIFMMQNRGRELVYPDGRRSGFPDTGSVMDAGFYNVLDDAIQAVEENSCDIREFTYNSAFVLTHFPGVYNNSCGKEGRMYFEWDEDKEGYVQKEEPEIFGHVAY